MKKRLLITLTLAGTCFPVFAQNPGIIFRDLSKERNTSASVAESHRIRSGGDSRSAVLLPPDTTKMVSGSSRIVLMTGQDSVNTKTLADTLSGREPIGRWITPEFGNNNKH